MKEEIKLLKKMINEIRDIRSYSIKSDDIGEEELYYLQEGFREGLCGASMVLADELDMICNNDIYLKAEEEWWHTHNDSEGDVGNDKRL